VVHVSAEAGGFGETTFLFDELCRDPNESHEDVLAIAERRRR
jgi:hypothetical protein